MSEFSAEVRHVVDNSIVEEMTDTMNDILKREPYSIDNKKLQKDRRKLSKLSNIYDFLQEYITGAEEMKYQELWGILRLAGPMVVNPHPVDYTPILNSSLECGYYTISFAGESGLCTPFSGVLPYGHVSFTVKYNGVVGSTRLIHDQKMIGNNGNEITFNNVFIDLPGEFEFRAYDKHGSLITTLLTRYTVGDASLTECPRYNILDTKGLPVELILP